MQINVEVTGFYYRRSVVLSDDDGVARTVKDAMEAAAALAAFPRLSFAGEIIDGKEFLDNITVIHDGGTAESGQKDVTAPRVYANGTYAAADDFVIFGEVDGQARLISPEGKKIISAWQYYVYDVGSVDVNRKFGPRRVVPYSVPFSTGENIRGLKDQDTVVWRRVSICLEPSAAAPTS